MFDTDKTKIKFYEIRIKLFVALHLKKESLKNIQKQFSYTCFSNGIGLSADNNKNFKLFK